jgi:hypothetical protein
MPTSYSKFTFEDIRELGIRLTEQPVFSQTAIPEIAPSDFLKKTLERNLKLKLRSEKAKSEFIISPILAELQELNQNKFSFFSGYKFDVDAKRGLKGYCDYVFSRDPNAVVIETPVFCIVEAKNDNLEDGVPQCVAEMYAAQTLNKQRNQSVNIIFGAVTFGFQWKIVQLKDSTAQLDTRIYYLNELPQLLGVLQHIVNVSA